MIILIFFITGLIVGSFLNVLAMRLHTAEEIFLSRSKCPRCKKLIHWYDNIPVLSFIFLKFRCRDCQKPISWLYPTVEIFTGVVFALVGWQFFQLENFETWLLTFFHLVIASSLVVILVYDWLYMEIPSSVLWVAVFFGGGFQFVA
jgi:prepilin signal peptidase PulO-like enzyme (type II secretory pathway)